MVCPAGDSICPAYQDQAPSKYQGQVPPLGEVSRGLGIVHRQVPETAPEVGSLICPFFLRVPSGIGIGWSSAWGGAISANSDFSLTTPSIYRPSKYIQSSGSSLTLGADAPVRNLGEDYDDDKAIGALGNHGIVFGSLDG